MPAHVVLQLRRERPGADARRIGLDDAEHVVERLRAHARARQRAADRRVRRRHERIRAEVDVEHRALRAFEQHVLARVVKLAQRLGHVGDERPDPLGGCCERADLGLDVDPLGGIVVLQQEVVPLDEPADLRLQLRRVEQVGDTHRAARDLVLVSGPDAAPRRADRAGAPRLLASDVERAVRGQDQRAGRREPETAVHVDAARGELVDFRRERLERDDDAVADEADRAVAQYARRDQMQDGLHAVDDERVARVVPALKTHDGVRAVGEDVDHRALALVAPLRADHDDVAAHVTTSRRTAATGPR